MALTVKALIPGIVVHARRAGIELPHSDAEVLADGMLEFYHHEDRMVFLDERLSERYDAYHLHLFLTKRPDYRVTINA